MLQNNKNSTHKVNALRFYSQAWGRGLASLLAGSCLLLGSTIAVADFGEFQWQKTLNVDDGSWGLTAFEGAEFRSDESILVSGAGGGGIAVRYDAETGMVLDTPPQWIDFETVTSNSNYFFDQVTASNGDIFFAGRHNVFDPGVWKYNSSGVLQSGWPKVNAGNGDGLNTGVALDSLGFVYSAGYNDSGWLISKHDASDGTVPAGFPISYNPGYGGKASHVAVDSEDNFIVSGWVGVAGPSYDWHVRKYASDGALLWQTSYDLKGNIEAAIDVAVDSEDNVIVIGYRNDGTDEGAGIARDWYMVKYAKDGDGVGNATILWEQSWNSGKASVGYVARTLLIDSKDNVYVGGEQPDSSGALSRPLVQYRDGQTGALIRSQEIGHPLTVRGAAGTAVNEKDYIKGLALNGDQLVVVGYVWEDYFTNGRTAWISMYKLLPGVGNEDWSNIYYPPTSTYNGMFLDVDFLPDGKVLATGDKPWGLGLAVRYDADTGATVDTPAEWISLSNLSGIQFRGQTFDSGGNIYFAGIEGSTSTMKVWKFSTANTSTPEWVASGPSGSINNYSVAVDSSGNSYSTGAKNNAVSGSSGADGILNKFDSNGNPAGAPFPIAYDHNNLSDEFFGVAVDSDDNVIVSGRVSVDAVVDHADGLVQKYNSSGTLLWQRQYDGIDLSDHARRVAVDSDDNIIVVGNTLVMDQSTGSNSDWYIIKYDPDGNLLWQHTWDDGTGRNGYGRDIAIDEQNNLYVVGEQQNIDGMARTYIQYRDGQTGGLLKLQALSHAPTYHDNPTTESDRETSIGFKDGKLVVSGYIDDASNPSTHDRSGFVIALDRTFVVSPSAGANGSVVPATKVEGVAYQGTVDITANADSNYHVASVSGCGIDYTNTDNSVISYHAVTGEVTADCEVSATFAINTYTVTPSVIGNGSIAPGTAQTLDYNTPTQFTLTADDHWHLVDVSGSCPLGALVDNGDGSWTQATAAVTADCTVSANFAIDTNTATPSVSGNGAISPDTPQSVAYNDAAQFTLAPDDHHHIGDIGGSCPIGDPPLPNGPGTWAYTTAAITADCTVIANFVIDTYTVTPSASGSGSISPDTDQTVAHNEPIQFILDPADHFHIGSIAGTCPTGSVLDNVDGTWTYTTGAITADCTVTADFAIDTLVVTPSTDGNGATDPSSQTDVDYNTRVAFTLMPNMSYHPDIVDGSCPAGSLLDNQDGTWTYTTGLITVDCSVDFSFDNTFDVTPSSKGLGTIDPSATVESVTYGQTVVFTLTPATDQPPEAVTGTCPAGALVDEQDGSWTYTTGAIVEDCTVIATFEDDTTFFVIPIQGGKAVIFGL